MQRSWSFGVAAKAVDLEESKQGLLWVRHGNASGVSAPLALWSGARAVLEGLCLMAGGKGPSSILGAVLQCRVLPMDLAGRLRQGCSERFSFQ